jgi:hypothetical protein
MEFTDDFSSVAPIADDDYLDLVSGEFQLLAPAPAS